MPHEYLNTPSAEKPKDGSDEAFKKMLAGLEDAEPLEPELLLSAKKLLALPGVSVEAVRSEIKRLETLQSNPRFRYSTDLSSALVLLRDFNSRKEKTLH